MGKDGPTPTRRRARSTSCSTRSPESAARSRPRPRSCSRSERKPSACERPALSRLWESSVASLRVMRPRLTASSSVALTPSAVRRTPLRSVSRSAVRLACTASSRAGALVAVARLALARLAVARLAAGLRAVERLAAGLLAALLAAGLRAVERLAAGLLAALLAAGLRARLDDERDDLGWGIRPPRADRTRRTLVPDRRACLPTDEQAAAEVELVALEQVGVPARPGAALEIGAQAGEPLGQLVLAALGQRRDAGAHSRVEVRLGPAPECAEEAVAAVPRDRHDLGLGAQRGGLLGQRGKALRVLPRVLGEVLRAQPHAPDVGRVPGEDDDA